MDKVNLKKSLTLLIALLSIQSCIEPLHIIPNDFNSGELLVSGTISDQPGPYIVKVSLTQDVFDGDLRREDQFPASRVVITDDQGLTEELIEVEPGIFNTTTLQGVIGRSYQIHIETKDGATYESIPDKLYPVGTLDSLYFEYASSASDDSPQYNFYVDSHLFDQDSYVRWKVTNTYFIETRPDLHVELDKRTGGESAAPFKCSGVVVINHFEEQFLRSIGECTCCSCWIVESEKKPLVNDGQFVADGYIKKQYIGTVPVNYATFNDKLVVDVDQMSLSKNGYQFWKTLQTQIESNESLFQPLYGTLPTNILDKDGKKKAHGFFFAIAEKKKRVIIRKEDLPDKLPTPVKVFTIPCTDFDYSTTTKPIDWPE